MNKIWGLCSLGLVLAVLAPPAIRLSAELQVRSDKENVVASRLVGQWDPDVELTKRLGGSAPSAVAFTSDLANAVKTASPAVRVLRARPASVRRHRGPVRRLAPCRRVSPSLRFHASAFGPIARSSIAAVQT